MGVSDEGKGRRSIAFFELDKVPGARQPHLPVKHAIIIAAIISIARSPGQVDAA